MSEVPVVSIAIRAYRRAWLGGAIASVLGQTWRDLELVIYDDAGDLEDIAASFHDDRLRYVRAEEKTGTSGRFAAAVALCRGRYIGVLDDDDRYEPELVERLVSVLETNARAGAAVCRAVRDVEGVRTVEPAPGPPGRQTDLARKILIERWVVVPSMMLLRRAALDAAEALQPMPDGVAPDVFVNIRLALTGWDHVLIDDVLTVRGWHDEQLSRASSYHDTAVATFERLRIADPVLDRLRRMELARLLIVRASQYLLSNRRAEALADLRAARETDPAVKWFARRLLVLAARMPVLGVMAARAGREVRRRVRSVVS
ncbi:MAG TPA: glycosyltransferase family 2 protein [Thermoanaerobaculia bacterium]|jgi:glycosyltransferase involved in cell wall biosynthesis|nr:glycosyltransferase family 2 protein [Thermoanaerobaculia bacterium]